MLRGAWLWLRSISDASATTCSSGSSREPATPSPSGFIAAYDLATGKFDGLLQDASGKPLAINGIWALSPGNVSPSNSDAAAAPAAEMYFTAVQNHGSGGLFGYLTAVSAELTKGNDQ